MKNRTPIFITILAALACLAFAQVARAQLSPPPDGDYLNGTTAEGFEALFNVNPTVGIFNTGLGWVSLWSNASASFSTGVGAGTLFNSDAADNTAVGAATMFFNTLGADNTAVGTNALRGDPTVFNTGSFNNAVGSAALFSNSTGGDNDAIGVNALFSNSTGSANEAMGFDALFFNSTGFDNVAIGSFALDFNTIGFFNTVVGAGAGFNIVTGAGNTYIGESVAGPGDESNAIRINDFAGAPGLIPGIQQCFIGGLGILQTANNTTIFEVTYDTTTNQLGVDFAPNGKVAQNEFLKEQKKVEEQQASIAELKSTVALLTAQLKQQAAQIQKVSAQLQMQKPTTKVVVNKP